MNISRLFGVVAVALMSATAWAQNVNVNKQGVAIEGYDPVAYFVESKPMKGDPQFMAKAGGATYHFVSAVSRDAFLANPEKYQPQYGGFCAFGVAKGYKPEIDPTAFKVMDGKLYLNKNAEIQSRWNADVPGFIQAANEKWPMLSSK